MSEFSYQYKFLKSNEKKWVDMADEDTAIECMSRTDYQPMLAHIIDVMKDLLADEYELNEDQMKFMLLPYKVLGRRADEQLAVWNKKYWRQVKESKQK